MPGDAFPPAEGGPIENPEVDLLEAELRDAVARLHAAKEPWIVGDLMVAEADHRATARALLEVVRAAKAEAGNAPPEPVTFEEHVGNLCRDEGQ